MKEFKSVQKVNRVTEFVDRLARKAWEPFYKEEDGYTKQAPANQNYFDYNKNQVYELWNVLAKSSGAFVGALQRNVHEYLPNETDVMKAPVGFDIALPGSGFIEFEYQKLIEIIKSNEVSSVADAMVKTTAYLQTIAGSINHGQGRYLFRGQSNISYDLIPRLGRELATKIESGKISAPSSPLKISQIEKTALSDFQTAWGDIKKEEIDDIVASSYDKNHPAWWVLMQHYADGYGDGTRMLDVTSSLLFALLFACVKWDTGLVDESTDGVIYFFVEGQNCNVSDYSITTAPSALDFFNTHANVSTMIFNPPHNERSKAQSGGFIWWPEFWKPLNLSLPYLRIPKEYKKQIAKELLAFGVGPKEAVRGPKGLQNEHALRESLN